MASISIVPYQQLSSRIYVVMQKISQNIKFFTLQCVISSTLTDLGKLFANLHIC